MVVQYEWVQTPYYVYCRRRHFPEPVFNTRRPGQGRSMAVQRGATHRTARGRSVAVTRPPTRRDGFRSRATRLPQPRERTLQRSKTTGGSAPQGYQIVKSLKTGGMSDAITLVKKSGKLFIAKSIRVDHDDTLVRAELKVLLNIKSAGCKNLNKLVEHKWGPGSLSITFVLEYCDAGSLSDKIKQWTSEGSLAPEAFLWHSMLGIAQALAYLHHGIRDPERDRRDDRWDSTYHLDLKPQNVFLSAKDQRGRYPRIVVGDFGCAVTKSDIRAGRADGRRQRCGTPFWYPPEGLAEVVGSHNMRYGSETDIWQLGLTIHAMGLKIQSPDRRWLEPRTPCGSQYSDSLNSLVSQCFKEWGKRWTAAEIARQVHIDVRRKGLRL